MNAEQKRQLVLFGVAVGFLGTVATVAILGEKSKTPDVAGNQVPLSAPANAYDDVPPIPTVTVSVAEEKAQKIAKLQAEGYHCVTLEKGDWLTQILREEGAPGIDSGPYVVVHNDATKQEFETYYDLPNDVFPKEGFCFKDEKGETLLPSKPESHGVVFDKAIRQENRRFVQRSMNIQASTRSKFRNF